MALAVVVSRSEAAWASIQARAGHAYSIAGAADSSLSWQPTTSQTAKTRRCSLQRRSLGANRFCWQAESDRNYAFAAETGGRLAGSASLTSNAKPRCAIFACHDALRRRPTQPLKERMRHQEGLSASRLLEAQNAKGRSGWADRAAAAAELGYPPKASHRSRGQSRKRRARRYSGEAPHNQMSRPDGRIGRR